MRPLHLRLQAFGSYPGEEVVDFTLFNGIGTFLVTGPTGSGKTTVFDAMVYALYGELPGQRKGEGETRSHHADPAVETFVEFEFEVDGARYKVRRSPQQERQAKRGSGTAQQAATAMLAKIQPDGSAVSIATKATACSKECAALVGLTSEQFQRVVLLPQGKFNEFLVASEGDREPLLSQLFGGALYTEAVDWLKSTMRQLESRVADDDQQIEHHRTNAVDALSVVRREWLGLDEPEVDSDGNDLRQLDIDALRALVQQATSDRDERERRVEVLEHSAADLHAQLGAAEEQANRYDADAEHRAAIGSREAERDDVTAGMAAATRSATARPVVDAADRKSTRLNSSH